MSRDHDLSAYLAGELAPADRARFEARMAGDPRLAAEVAALQDIDSRLAQLPSEAWALVEDPPPAPVRPRPRWRLQLTPRGLAALGAAAAFVVGVIVGELVARTPAPTGRSVTLAPLGSTAAGGRAKATVTGASRIIITVSHLTATDAGHYYEAWLMTSAADLVALGSFRTDPDGRATLQTTLPADPHAYRYIDISLQQVGAGSQHSTDSVLRGPTPGP